MSIVADGHVHLYPCYRMETALASLAANLDRLGRGKGQAKVGLLAERSDCHVFRGLYDGSLRVPGWEVSPLTDAGGESVVAVSGRDRLHLFPGRQVATAERLEVLALMTDTGMPDGEPAGRVIEAAHSAGGLPALNWAPGKWLFGRAAIVGDLFGRIPPARLLVCDTSLRPKGWTEPRAMREAARHGFTVLAGSDPLPFSGQEQLPGTYGFVCDAPFDETAPAASLRSALTGNPRGFQRIGHRRGPLKTFLDIMRLKQTTQALASAPAEN